MDEKRKKNETYGMFGWLITDPDELIVVIDKFVFVSFDDVG
jgi:hypothetical protein